MATSATPEPVRLDYHQRGVTFDQIMKLVGEVLADLGNSTPHALTCAAVLSIEKERDTYRNALERIATGAYTSPGARDLAREALG